MHGRLVHNVPITICTETFLHTVCAATIKDICLLGLDFIIVTDTILNLSQHTLTVDDEVKSVSVNKHPGLQVSNVSIVKRTVVQPHSVGFVPSKLDTPIDDTYMVSGASNKNALVSNIYGNGTSVILNVINESDNFVTFKKEKSIGHAESPELVTEFTEHSDINRATENGEKQKEPRGSRLT